MKLKFFVYAARIGLLFRQLKVLFIGIPLRWFMFWHPAIWLGYAVITLHRPSNVDDMDTFEQIISAFEVIEKDMKLIFPIHPRNRKNIKATDHILTTKIQFN